MAALGAVVFPTAALRPYVFAASTVWPVIGRSATVEPSAVGASAIRTTSGWTASVRSPDAESAGRQTPSAAERQVIQHIVLFTPKAGLTHSELKSFAQSVLGVLAGSKDVSRASIGRRIAVDAGYERSFGDKAYKYSAVLEFEDKSALIRYLNGADHGQLGRLFWQTCADTVVTEVEAVDVKAAGAESMIDELV